MAGRRRSRPSRNAVVASRTYSAPVDRRPSARCASTRAMTSASKPRPAAKTNQRGSVQSSGPPSSVPEALAVPRDTSRVRPARTDARISAVASIGSRDRPSAREKTLVEPPGTTASVGRCGEGPFSSSPLTTSFTVPSPPTETTRSMPSAAARAPSSAAWPRCEVSTTSSLSSLARAPTSTSRIFAVVLVAAGLTTTSARMDPRLATRGPFPLEEGPVVAGPPRNLGSVTEPAGVPPQPRGRRSDRILGGAARPSAPRPERPRTEAPRSLRWAAAVVGIEAAALAVGAVLLLYLVVTSTADSVAAAVGEVVFVAAGAAVLAAAALGLRRVAGWARGPVVVLQLLLAALAYTTAFEAGHPAIGLPVLVLVAVELYLLATPESRLAYSERTRGR